MTIWVGQLRTYIVSELLPLQLLERKRSEFLSGSSGVPLAKPSVDKNDDVMEESEDDDNGIKWTKSTLCSSNVADDLIRRSDLIFAFNPNILPFRRDAARLKRIELIIRAEASVTMARRSKLLESTARAAWTWLCTFDESVNEEDAYVDAVGRIVNALDVPAVKFLASLDTPNGTVLATAHPECANIIQLKLDGRAIPSRAAPASRTIQGSSETESVQRSILKSSVPRSEAEIPYIVDGALSKSILCREIFNLREQAFPTCFVLLPYELTRNDDGSMGLGSQKSAPIAVQFAACLTDLTEPWHINHVLEKKAIDCLGHQLTQKRAMGFQSFQWRSKNVVQRLIDLFDGKGYLYLLDENSGAPIVPSATETSPVSPIKVDNPKDVLENLLPLLLMGMIRMRGEKAMVVLVQTMVAGKRAPPEKWITIMQNIVRHLYLKGSTLSADEGERRELLALSEALSDFVSRTTRRNTTRRPESDDGHEWAQELSYLETLLKDTALLNASRLPGARLHSFASAEKRMSLALAISASLSHDASTVCSSASRYSQKTTDLGNEEEDPLLQGRNEDFDMIWSPEKVGGDRQKEPTLQAQQTKESTKSSTSHYIPSESRNAILGNLLAEETAFEPSESDCKQTEKGASTKQETQQTDFPASSNEVYASAKPPLSPTKSTSTYDHRLVPSAQSSSRLAYGKEEKLKAIKQRLETLDGFAATSDSSLVEFKPTYKTVMQPLLFDRDESDLDSLLSDECNGAEDNDKGDAVDARDDYATELLSRLLGLEERIHDREEEMEDLRHDVNTFEMKAADAIYEALSRDEDGESSFGGSTGKSRDTASFGSTTKSSHDSTFTSMAGDSSDASMDETSYTSYMSDQKTATSSITSKPSTGPKRQATFTFEDASSSYVSSSSDDEETSASSSRVSNGEIGNSSGAFPTSEGTSYASSSYYDTSSAGDSSSATPPLSKEEAANAWSPRGVDSEDAPGNQHSFGRSVKEHRGGDVPGNPFSGDEEDSPSKPTRTTSNGPPGSPHNLFLAPDSPNNPFTPPDSPNNPFSDSGSLRGLDSPGNPFAQSGTSQLDLFITPEGRALVEI